MVNTEFFQNFVARGKTDKLNGRVSICLRKDAVNKKVTLCSLRVYYAPRLRQRLSTLYFYRLSEGISSKAGGIKNI